VLAGRNRASLDRLLIENQKREQIKIAQRKNKRALNGLIRIRHVVPDTTIKFPARPAIFPDNFSREIAANALNSRAYSARVALETA